MGVERMAFGERQVTELTGLKKGRLRWWAKDLFPPSVRSEAPCLYSFRDLVGLRVCKQLRDDGISRQELSRVDPYLKRFSVTPWASLRIRLSLSSRTIEFFNPDSQAFESTNPEGQKVFDYTIELDAVADLLEQNIAELRKRPAEHVGKIEKRKSILRNASVIRGTRIPTSAIWNYHSDDYTVDQIREQYPGLEREDIESAIEYEETRRQSTA